MMEDCGQDISFGLTKRGGFFILKKAFLWDIEALKWAVNSAGECYLHTVEVAGSIPAPPTNDIKWLWFML